VDSIVTPPPRPQHPTPLAFTELCERLGMPVEGPANVSVTGVSINASQVVPGDVFVAIPGSVHHGALFAAEAINRGATAIITDAEGTEILGSVDASVGVTETPRALLGVISREVYQTGSAAPQVLAVTGTNGKTSVIFWRIFAARLAKKLL